MKIPKTFIGYTNFRFVVKELVKMYSGEKSFFSKKRIESGIAFIIGQWGMIHWLIINVNELKYNEFLWWAAAEFAITGYTLKQIQEEKKLIQNG